MKSAEFFRLMGQIACGWPGGEIVGTLDRDQAIYALRVARRILERVMADAPEVMATTDGVIHLGDAARKTIELIEQAESDHQAAQGRLL